MPIYVLELYAVSILIGRVNFSVGRAATKSRRPAPFAAAITVSYPGPATGPEPPRLSGAAAKPEHTQNRFGDQT